MSKTDTTKHLKRIQRILDKKKQADKLHHYQQTIGILEIIKDFIRSKRLLVYGGLALNCILPKQYRFYEELDIPDVDFFSYNAFHHAKKLADAIKAKGYKYVEVKAGIHYETFKVYVNFEPVADVTDIPKRLFMRMVRMSKDEIAITRKYAPDCDIPIAPLYFLRMSMHIELSRPDGYVERWTKVFKRMTLLYDFFPEPLLTKCMSFHNEQDTRVLILHKHLIDVARTLQTPICGIEGIKMYLKRGNVDIRPDALIDTSMTLLDVISITYEDTVKQMKMYLEKYLLDGEKLVVKSHAPLNSSELLPRHKIIYLQRSPSSLRPLVGVYKSQACYAYKVVNGTRYASIDTILSIMYAWLLADRVYLNVDKIKCLMSWLLHIQYVNLESDDKVFQMFEQRCYGNQRKIENAKRDFWNKGKDQVVYRPRN